MPADVVVKSESRAPGVSRLGGLFAHGDKRWFSALMGLVLAVLVLPSKCFQQFLPLTPLYRLLTWLLHIP